MTRSGAKGLNLNRVFVKIKSYEFINNKRPLFSKQPPKYIQVKIFLNA